MQNDNELLANLNGYYDKLIKILRYEASFKLAGKGIYDKTRIDDVMCCIDANFPKEFQQYKEKYGDINRQIRTLKLNVQLTETIKRKPPIGTSSYMVKIEEALSVIERLKKAIPADLNYIKANYTL